MLHQSIILDVNADSTEWCPWDGHHGLLAVGTYELDETNRERIGILHMYNLEDTSLLDSSMSSMQQDRHGSCNVKPNEADVDTCLDPPPQISLLQKLHLPGIFDLKWSPTASSSQMLGAALADGTIRCYRLKEDAKEECPESIIGSDDILTELTRCHCFPRRGGGMALSLDWQGR